MRYRTQIAATGKNTAGIPVPDDVLAALGGSKRPAVSVTVGGHSYRTTVGTVDGAAMISLSMENRNLAGVAAGDTVDVDVELDTAPREVEIPTDLATALRDEPTAQATWDGMSYSNRRWHVLQLESAKTPETRQRRVEKSVAMLREGRAR